MRILHFYPALFPIKMYGGTPRVVQWLMKEQVKMGHQVFLMALPGSRIDGVEVVEVPENADPEALDRLAPSGVDIIHAYAYTEKHDTKKPMLITYDRMGMIKKFHPNTVFCSKRHAEIHHGKYFIHYGVAAEEYDYSDEKEDYFMFLAMAGWQVKNLEGAIRAVKDAGVKLVVAGGYRPSLSGKITSVGMLGDKRKKELLSRARALLFPVIWDEPFGIVMIEAFACGTPVIGTPFGSLPEVIKKDAGFVCQSHQELASAIKNINSISNRACREQALGYFSIRRMAEDYQKIYEKILERGQLDQQPFLAGDAQPGLQLRLYEGYRPPGFLWRRFGTKLTTLYTNYRESRRVYESDEVSAKTKDLTNFG
jgi:glycosyltransferase involved in cell wall biosynthesis